MPSDTDQRFERQLFWGLLVFLAAAITVSTCLHYLAPGILRVPSDKGLPPLDPSPWIGEPVTYLLAFLCGYHCYRKRGFWQLLLFVSGCFFFPGIQENTWILIGRFGVTPPTYYYSPIGHLWLLEMPVVVCVGWFIFAYSCVYVAETLLGTGRTWLIAALGAWLATNIDLFLDPVVANPVNHSWTWLQINTLWVFSIPISNFIGWFFVIFIFVILWRKTLEWGTSLGVRRATWKFFVWIPVLDILFFAVYFVLRFYFINPLFGGINLTFGGI